MLGAVRSSTHHVVAGRGRHTVRQPARRTGDGILRRGHRDDRARDFLELHAACQASRRSATAAPGCPPASCHRPALDTEPRRLRRQRLISTRILAPQHHAGRGIDDGEVVAGTGGVGELLIRGVLTTPGVTEKCTSFDATDPRMSGLATVSAPVCRRDFDAEMSRASMSMPTERSAATSAAADEDAGSRPGRRHRRDGREGPDGADQSSLTIEDEARVALEDRDPADDLLAAQHPQAAALMLSPSKRIVDTSAVSRP